MRWHRAGTEDERVTFLSLVLLWVNVELLAIHYSRTLDSLPRGAINATEDHIDLILLDELIITPFPEQVPLRQCNLNPGLRQIIEEYEPEVVNGGLYRHQADFLNAFAAKENGDFIMITFAVRGS